MDFARDIKAFEDKANAEMNKSVTKAVEILFFNVVALTPSPINPGPWAKGHLANQWYPAVGDNPDTSTSDSVSNNGSDSLRRIKGLLSLNLFHGKDRTITLTNSVTYAYRAEHLGWPKGYDSDSGWTWSGRRPRGYKMVTTAVNNFKGLYS